MFLFSAEYFKTININNRYDLTCIDQGDTQAEHSKKKFGHLLRVRRGQSREGMCTCQRSQVTE